MKLEGAFFFVFDDKVDNSYVVFESGGGGGLGAATERRLAR